MEQAARDWMEANHARWAPNTFERYYGIVRDFIVPSLGKKPLVKVDRRVLKRFLRDLLSIRSAKTVELIHSVISGILSEAIDNGFITENPARGLPKKILPAKKLRRERVPDPFTRQELITLLENCERHLNRRIAMVIETLALTGMRLGECLAMHRDHLDVQNCQYMIVETVRHGRFGSPKTGKRLIDLPEVLVTKLEGYILELRKEALRTGAEDGYLFAGITQRMVQSGLRRACRLSKLRVRSPHELRHTYASLLLMDHYSPAYVQKQLGHHSITMTVDIYGHWIPGEGKKNLSHTLAVTGQRHQGGDGFGSRKRPAKIANVLRS
ncbi:integrase [Desulfacinum hydrothermale DSM 13146]|uniref:Integrase n=1 Tax=Desulfacinum hydrothermale DSM 13146 TaxID=1121390 RepID=A0A1W1XS03_9BACT|nr:site-specific integrase [Desulfacinum hydrothermale]SMC26644.1 integrase [Desulfacinum hydrothermale DSM 13146]